MGGWTYLSDPSWQKFEQVFSIQKTPPLQYRAPQTPKAPKKTNSQISRRNLKPRKLIYEMDDTMRQEDRPNKTLEESGIVLWATSSATLRVEDANKENRPESADIISNSQPNKIEPGSLRHQMNQLIGRKSSMLNFY